MSRYTIPGSKSIHTIVIGYDPPLQTYFAQVYDLSRPTGEDHAVGWFGTQPSAIRTVEQLQYLLRNYATLTKEQCAALQQDQDGAAPPTPLQQWVLRCLVQEGVA